jgi:hypothetical protein
VPAIVFKPDARATDGSDEKEKLDAAARAKKIADRIAAMKKPKVEQVVSQKKYERHGVVHIDSPFAEEERVKEPVKEIVPPVPKLTDIIEKLKMNTQDEKAWEIKPKRNIPWQKPPPPPPRPAKKVGRDALFHVEIPTSVTVEVAKDLYDEDEEEKVGHQEPEEEIQTRIPFQAFQPSARMSPTVLKGLPPAPPPPPPLRLMAMPPRARSSTPPPPPPRLPRQSSRNSLSSPSLLADATRRIEDEMLRLEMEAILSEIVSNAANLVERRSSQHFVQSEILSPLIEEVTNISEDNEIRREVSFVMKEVVETVNSMYLFNLLDYDSDQEYNEEDEPEAVESEFIQYRLDENGEPLEYRQSFSDIYSGESTKFVFQLDDKQRKTLTNPIRKAKSLFVEPTRPKATSDAATHDDIDIHETFTGIYASNKTHTKFEGYNEFSAEKDITGFTGL